MLHKVLAAQKSLASFALIAARAACLPLSVFEQGGAGYSILSVTLAKHGDDDKISGLFHQTTATK